MTDWDYKFVSDVSTHTMNGSALSEKQSVTLLKILNNNIGLFDKADQPAVRGLLVSPVYRQPLYTSVNITREVRWIGGATVLFRFPYNAQILAAMKEVKNCMDYVILKDMVRDLRSWKVIIDSTNYKSVMAFIQAHSFNFDDETLNFFLNVANNISKPNVIEVSDDAIKVTINNDAMAALWLESMEWLEHA